MSYVNKPGKNSAWKKHLIKNLVAEVIMYESVTVNSSHAKMLTKPIAKLIGWAKKGDLHSRRLSLRYLDNRKNTLTLDKGIGVHMRTIDKLFDIIGKRYINREGGYTRMIKRNNRMGDNSPVITFSLV